MQAISAIEFFRGHLQVNYAEDVDETQDGSGEEELEADENVKVDSGDALSDLDSNVNSSTDFGDNSDPGTQEGVDLSEERDVGDGTNSDEDISHDGDGSVDVDIDVRCNEDISVDLETAEESDECLDVSSEGDVSFDVGINLDNESRNLGDEGLDGCNSIGGCVTGSDLAAGDGSRESSGHQAEDGDGGDDELREEHG